MDRASLDEESKRLLARLEATNVRFGLRTVTAEEEAEARLDTIEKELVVPREMSDREIALIRMSVSAAIGFCDPEAADAVVKINVTRGDV